MLHSTLATESLATESLTTPPPPMTTPQPLTTPTTTPVTTFEDLSISRRILFGTSAFVNAVDGTIYTSKGVRAGSVTCAKVQCESVTGLRDLGIAGTMAVAGDVRAAGQITSAVAVHAPRIRTGHSLEIECPGRPGICVGVSATHDRQLVIDAVGGVACEELEIGRAITMPPRNATNNDDDSVENAIQVVRTAFATRGVGIDGYLANTAVMRGDRVDETAMARAAVAAAGSALERLDAAAKLVDTSVVRALRTVESRGDVLAAANVRADTVVCRRVLLPAAATAGPSSSTTSKTAAALARATYELGAVGLDGYVAGSLPPALVIATSADRGRDGGSGHARFVIDETAMARAGVAAAGAALAGLESMARVVDTNTITANVVACTRLSAAKLVCPPLPSPLSSSKPDVDSAIRAVRDARVDLAGYRTTTTTDELAMARGAVVASAAALRRLDDLGEHVETANITVGGEVVAGTIRLAAGGRLMVPGRRTAIGNDAVSGVRRAIGLVRATYASESVGIDGYSSERLPPELTDVTTGSVDELALARAAVASVGHALARLDAIEENTSNVRSTTMRCSGDVVCEGRGRFTTGVDVRGAARCDRILLPGVGHVGSGETRTAIEAVKAAVTVGAIGLAGYAPHLLPPHLSEGSAVDESAMARAAAAGAGDAQIRLDAMHASITTETLKASTVTAGIVAVDTARANVIETHRVLLPGLWTGTGTFTIADEDRAIAAVRTTCTARGVSLEGYACGRLPAGIETGTSVDEAAMARGAVAAVGRALDRTDALAAEAEVAHARIEDLAMVGESAGRTARGAVERLDRLALSVETRAIRTRSVHVIDGLTCSGGASFEGPSINVKGRILRPTLAAMPGAPGVAYAIAAVRAAVGAGVVGLDGYHAAAGGLPDSVMDATRARVDESAMARAAVAAAGNAHERLDLVERLVSAKPIAIASAVASAKSAHERLDLMEKTTADPGKHVVADTVHASRVLMPLAAAAAAADDAGLADAVDAVKRVYDAGAVGLRGYVAEHLPPEAVVSVVGGVKADETVMARAAVAAAGNALARLDSIGSSVLDVRGVRVGVPAISAENPIRVGWGLWCDSADGAIACGQHTAMSMETGVQTRSMPFGVSHNMSGGSAYFGGKVLASEFISFSDKRLKRDVREIQPERCTDLVRDVLTHEYEHDGWKKYGFVAQQMEECIPQAVRSGPGVIDGRPADDVLSIDTNQVIALLTGCVRDLLRRVDVLENEAARR